MLVFLPVRSPGRNLSSMLGPLADMLAPSPRCGTLMALCLLAACSNSPPPLVLDVRVVTPAGQNPVAGGGFDTASVRLREGDAELRELTAPVSGGRFDFTISFSELDPEIALGLELSGPANRLIGAPPVFRPVLSGGSLVIPMGAPGSCESLAGLALDTPRADLGFAQAGTFALTVGGRKDGSVESDGRYLDLLLLTAGPAFDLGLSSGPTRAAAYSDDAILLLAEDQTSLLAEDVLPVILHAGAGPYSAVASRPGGGLAVVGGGSADAPVAGVSYVDIVGTIERLSELTTPRFRPAAALVGDRVWVAGGASGAGALVEVISPGVAPRVLVPDQGDGVRLGAALFVDPLSPRALLLGGVDASGGARTDTWLISCAADCSATPGPVWDQARDGVVYVPEARLLVGGDGPSALLERVVFDTGGARIEAAGRLVHARTHAAALSLASGLLWVVGGEDDAGLRRDVELCFPPELLAP
ncbi:MAG: hypothetical protein GXP55_08475 [Deltaproteobacteria bacterium]|nr:hypothetical protein [Deltaproteobacteria bacterium]